MSMENDTYKNNTPKLCSSYQGSFVIGIESGVLLVLSVLSLILNNFHLQVLLRSGGHLPASTKLLLINCTAAAIVKSAFFVLRAVYNFFLLRYGFVYMSFDRTICIFIEIPYGISTMIIVLTMIFIGFERLWSTFQKNLSQQRDNVDCGIISIQLLIWALSVLIYVIVFMMDKEPTVRKICYCYFPLLLQPYGSMFNRTIIIGTQTLNMLIYFVVYWRNKTYLMEFTLNAARHSLTERFIMWSNVKTTKMLIPASITHAVTYDFVVLLSVFLPKIIPTISADANLCVTIFTFCLLCLDNLLQPVLCLRFNESLRDIGVNSYPILRFVVGGSTTSVTYKRSTKEVNPNVQETVPSKQHQSSLGAKTIVEYRVKPDDHQDILNQMWNDVGKKNPKRTSVKPIG